MGRIALIAEEMGRPEDARMVAARLAEASQVRARAAPHIVPCSWLGKLLFASSDEQKAWLEVIVVLAHVVGIFCSSFPSCLSFSALSAPSQKIFQSQRSDLALYAPPQFHQPSSLCCCPSSVRFSEKQKKKKKNRNRPRRLWVLVHNTNLGALPAYYQQTKVWLNGTAGSPLIYDFRWGGVVTCGCAYKKGQGCTNGIGPHQCPGLSDPGMNFGLGFYNDHHFHFGEKMEKQIHGPVSPDAKNPHFTWLEAFFFSSRENRGWKSGLVERRQAACFGLQTCAPFSRRRGEQARPRLAVAHMRRRQHPFSCRLSGSYSGLRLCS